MRRLPSKLPLSIFFLILPGIVVSLTGWVITAQSEPLSEISGSVVDSSGPIKGAHVRVRGTENLTTSDDMGNFTLSGLDAGEEVEITAWHDGYYIASMHVTPPASDILMDLRPYHTTDHPDYEWVSPEPSTSDDACGNCHPMILPQWENNAHGGAIYNERFYSLYNGTDISGTNSIGPGYLKDFPSTLGVCASCHAPGAGVDGYLTTDMNSVRDEITSGIHCDFCHKIGGAFLDPATGTVYPNAPGTVSLRVLRPPENDQIFFGPYDDIHDPDTYLPLISESQFCAACHQFSFWGTPIYESYDEWLASEYAEEGITCQDCHMLPNGDTYFALPEVGGIEHPPETIPSHLQLGATSTELLQNTVNMYVEANQVLDHLLVTVTITNTDAGHHVPTDFPGRQMILTLNVEDNLDHTLTQENGSVLPTWAGPEAGQPGIVFAKVLQDIETGEYPVVNYWKQTQIVSDNRIPALGTSVSTYDFDLIPEGTEVEITASLIFRRVFYDLADQKEWDVPDILMEEESVTIGAQTTYETFLPIIKSNILSSP